MPVVQIDTDKVDQKVKPAPDEMSFLEHLEALRWHILRGAASLFVFSIILFLFRNFIFDHIILAHRDPNFITYRLFCDLARVTGIDQICFHPSPFKLVPIALEEQFILSIKVSVIVGIIIAFPYIFWEIWRFVKPGLYEKERHAVRGVVGICSGLFFTGILFGYFIMAPFAITFLSNYTVGTDIVTEPRLASYVDLVTMIVLPAGFVFELPIVVYILSKVGLLTPGFMRTYRRHAIVVILTVAAIITPSPDAFSQLLVGIPLYFLYELSIHISRRVQKEQEAEAAKG